MGVARGSTRLRWLQGSASALVLAGMISHVGAAPGYRARPGPSSTKPQNASLGSPEARLIEILKLIAAGDGRHALDKAATLAQDTPNFQLAQLVYGDLLMARQGKLDALSAVPPEISASASDQWLQLRKEASLRLAALTERPPANAIPRQFLDIPPSTRHAIAVDASRSRLYVFANDAQGLRLIADHYVSLGRLGIDKREQGDQRTPMGVYFITSRLASRQLKEFYGPGALTLNYPNEYDRRRGKTGGGIWLHGVPPQNYARSPQSTDGCVVLANADLMSLIQSVALRRTPVLITQRIDWVSPTQTEAERNQARALVEQWRQARSQRDLKKLIGFYSSQFSSGGADLTQWEQTLDRQLHAKGWRESELKEVSILSWRDSGEVLVVTFGEVLKGQRTGLTKRQYWGREGGQWKIFFEGVIG